MLQYHVLTTFITKWTCGLYIPSSTFAMYSFTFCSFAFIIIFWVLRRKLFSCNSENQQNFNRLIGEDNSMVNSKSAGLCSVQL